MSEILDNPAIIAAQLAEAKINAAIKAGRSFRLEAGAGAGKTFSLVHALKSIIK
ncbi:ATP-dependent helicase, partial [Acinetobacter baumannii]